MPSITMLLGDGGRGSQEILSKINNRWGNTGVVFGSSSDPFADRFSDFRKAFVNVARDTAEFLNNSAMLIMDRNEIVELKNAKSLMNVPPCMYIPILSYPPVRELFDKELIYGWGIRKDTIPVEDEYSRIINNGYIGPDPITGVIPDEYEWHWKSDDPEHTIDELDMLMRSRMFVDAFIREQTKPGGSLLDPTDMLDCGLIGDLR
jgi:hypothetical protein